MSNNETEIRECLAKQLHIDPFNVRGLLKEIEAIRAKLAEAKKDSARLDWLADPKNTVGNVVLPREYIMDNLDSMRAAIDAAMEGGK